MVVPRPRSTLVGASLFTIAVADRRARLAISELGQTHYMISEVHKCTIGPPRLSPGGLTSALHKKALRRQEEHLTDFYSTSQSESTQLIVHPFEHPIAPFQLH